MALRFQKSFKIAPGIRLNLSKRGVGVSAGVKGARVGVNSKGTYSSIGIPGTGISSLNYHNKRSAHKKITGQKKIPWTKSNSISLLVLLSLIAFLINITFGFIVIILSIIVYKYKIKKSFIEKVESSELIDETLKN